MPIRISPMAQGLYLSQKMALSQVLAPQLQQSLALLQAPTLDLKAMVEQELQQNPLLEEVSGPELSPADKEEGLRDGAMDAADPAEPPSDVKFDPATQKATNEPVDDFQAEFERLTQLDQEWRDHFSQTNLPVRASSEEQDKRQFMFDSLVTPTSLQEDILEQARESDLTPEQWPLAENLIGNIDERGYLNINLDELATSTGIPVERHLEVLKMIQSFDPPGVGARDLRECLLLQLERARKRHTLQYRIVSEYMDALGKRRLPEIAKGLDLPMEEIQEAVKRIAHLEPHPGREFLPDNDIYILPEVFVNKSGDDYVVTTNDEHIPRLRISNTYKDLMAQANSSAEVRNYIREKINAGKFLIKSLHQRQTTILNIAKEIVNRQREFMDKGVASLKPLTMAQ